MKFRLSLTLSIFLLVVIPILATGLVSMETASKALELQAQQAGISIVSANLAFNRLRESIVYLLIIGTVVSLTGAGFFVSWLASAIQTIHIGLAALGHDRTVTLPPLPGVMGEIATDINLMAKALRESEEQVLRSSRLAALGELSAGIAHEIRNPLTSIKGYAQLLADELPADDEKLQYTQIIEREVFRMERIIQGLLDFAHPNSSIFQRIKLSDVLHETLLLVNLSTFRQRLRLILDCDPNIVVEADPEQLKQIFLNLILNAAQAITDCGSITITSSQDEYSVIICVHDDGPGIPSEHIHKLFTPFFTTKEKGTGLGLSIVHRLIELHHGRITVDSSPARGTTFTIELPLKQEYRKGGANGANYFNS